MSEYDNLLKSELIKQAQEMEETIGNCLEEISQLKAENEALKNNDVFSIRLFKDKADKYEKALKEIKEATEQAKKHEFVNMTDYWNCVLTKCEVINE